MKHLLTSFFLLLGTMSWAATAIPQADSLVILFGNKTRLVIHTEDKEGIQQLSNYDINKIIRDMGLKLDSARNGETFIVIDENKVQRYLQDTVLVVTRKDGRVTVTVKESENDGNYRKDSDERTQVKRKRSDQRTWNISFGGTGFGLNNLIEHSSNPAYPSDQYALRPLGSRYVSLGWGLMPTIARSKRVSLKVSYGLEVSWNNYMFDNNILVQKGPNGVVFADAGRELKKSKLTVCSVNVPFVPRVSFYNESGQKVFHFGVGAYAGYRVDSYTKIKELDGDKDHQRSNFYLNNFRYGLIAHLGIVRTNFFIKYDLNPLFMKDKGPDVRAISFGVSL